MARQQRFRPVHASAEALGEFRIGGDQQMQTAGPAQSGELAGDARALGRTKMAIDNSCSWRQPGRRRRRIWRALGVCEEKQRRNGRPADPAVEPLGEPR